MAEVIYVRRENSEIPYGFKLQGGSDFSIPLSILQITPNSVAERAGLRPGDGIIKINDVDTSHMEHGAAKMEIIRSGNDIKLTVIRNAVDPTKPQCTPLSQLKSNPPRMPPPVNYSAPSSYPRTDLTVDKGETINIGSSHNRAPMPFNVGVGTSIDYKSAKPSNWKAGDYTQWTPNAIETQNNGTDSNTVTAVFHNQYNTPIGMYSDSNVFQEFQNQTKGLLTGAHSNNSISQQSTTSSFLNQNFHQTKHSSSSQAHQQPRGVNSLSMRMLGSGIEQVEGTSQQPPSVFDLRHGNPTGATIPRGFKSVQAPTALPPEQRHAPMRKEYQVQHVKQNWTEPKFN